MPVETEDKRALDVELRVSTIDVAIAGLAERQHGVVARRQLLELGLGREAIAHRLECGRLHPFIAGCTPSATAPSAERHAGSPRSSVPGGAVLSHRSAATLWGLRVASAARIDVTVARKLPSRTDVARHHVELASDEVTVARGIPVTTWARTLLDLAATRSELEDRFLAFVDRAGLPRPEVNAALQLADGWIEADCLWRAPRLVVELDGYTSHATRAAFDHDRARDRTLQAAGWRVVRITWRHLTHDPTTLTAQLRELLT